MSEKTIGKNVNDDTAMLSGNIHIAINLLNEPLRAFVNEKVKMFSQTIPKAKRKRIKLHNLDFSLLLHYIKNNWSKKFAHCCSNDLLEVASVVIRIRNEISHQDFELNRYQSYMKQLAKLASLINRPEIEQKISSRFKIAIIEADVHVCEEEKQWWQLKDEGNNFYTEERWTEAMNCYTRAIRLDPTQAVLFSNRALCELQLKKYELGREDAEIAILLDSSKIKYYRILSEMLQQLNLFEESLKICERGLSLDSRDDVLLMRKRDCAGIISQTHTDNNNPRPYLKHGATYEDLAQEALKQLPKRINDLQRLTPKPEDIETLSKAGILKTMKLNCYILTAHKYLIDQKHQRKAFEKFEAAANEGSAEGLYNSVVFYMNGCGGIPRDTAKAEELFRKTVKQKPFLKLGMRLMRNIGVAEAENALGNIYRDGNGRDKDNGKAFQWYLKSAEHDCPEGQNNLGNALRYGLGCKQDLASARMWFEHAAERNIAEAQTNLAQLISEGQGGAKDTHRAYELFEAAAKQGMPNALAQLQTLAQTYAVGSSGKATAQNVIEEMSTNSNDPHSCLLLGINYFIGEGGVEKDFSLSEKFLKKAVEFGNNDAVLPLSEVLFAVKRNEEALRYLEQACELGKQEAYSTFGKYCAFGHGCTRNVEKARIWLNRANSLTKNAKGTGISDVEAALKFGADVVELEISTNNNSSGITFTERISRYLAADSKFDNIVDRELSKLYTKFTSHSQTSSPSELRCSMLYRSVDTWFNQMLPYAQSGSESAQNFFNANRKVNEAELLISNGKYSEGFRTVRIARRLWDLLVFDEITWTNGIQNALLQNADDAEVLYFKAYFSKDSSLKEKIHLVRRCIDIAPTVADFHHLLGSFYGFAGNFKDALHEYNRALELEFCPFWLYGKATALRCCIRWKGDERLEDANKAIFAYEKFLDNNPPDNRKVPEAYFAIGHIYMLLNEVEKAKLYWKKGIVAEQLRLPCFNPSDDKYFPRQSLQTFILLEQKVTQLQIQVVNKCANCNNEAKSRCTSCKCVWYCSKECQLKDWKSHKLACKKK